MCHGVLKEYRGMLPIPGSPFFQLSMESKTKIEELAVRRFHRAIDKIGVRVPDRNKEKQEPHTPFTELAVRGRPRCMSNESTGLTAHDKIFKIKGYARARIRPNRSPKPGKQLKSKSIFSPERGMQ
jgi:hypothetical protein